MDGASQPHLDTLATINAAQEADGIHNEAGDFNTANVDNPLARSVSVSLRASLNDLCLRKARSTWAPTSEALQSIFRQKRFTSLSGASEVSGDLKSVVLHSITMDSVKSSFPIAVGTQVTSVDNSTFSITGASFAAIVSPEAASNTAVTLQKDDVSLAYEASCPLSPTPTCTNPVLTTCPCAFSSRANFRCVWASFRTRSSSACRLFAGFERCAPDALHRVLGRAIQLTVFRAHTRTRRHADSCLVRLRSPPAPRADLTEKGVHVVDARKFVLIAADHPVVSALSENADRLQMGDICARLRPRHDP